MKKFIIFICALFVFGTCHALDLIRPTMGCRSGYYNTDDGNCVKCPDGTTTPNPVGGNLSIYHHYTQCAPAWLRYTYTPLPSDGIISLPQTEAIALNTEKQTTPALAMRVGDKTMYAAMARATTPKSDGMYVKYNNKSYRVLKSVPESKFQITTTPTTNNFNFTMSAAGTFYVDWGDGTVDEIVRTNTTEESYSHTYTTTRAYNIGFSGTATNYSTDDTTAAISFNGNTNIAKIDGSLGAIFPTIEGPFINVVTGKKPLFQPRFCKTFRDCTNLTTVSKNLFNGVSGAADNMFEQTFAFCTDLTEIPPGLFNGISGAAIRMFNSTFFGCSSLTEIPSGLFNGAFGAAHSMFGGTFKNCTSLAQLPPSLFNGEFNSAEWMFHSMFNNCTNLRGEIPYGFFGSISGAPAANMFKDTFSDCIQLTGPTAHMADGTPLYDIKNPETGKTWWNENPSVFYNMYTNTGITGVRG